MAKIFITEFNKVGGQSGAVIPVASVPASANQALNVTGVSAQSAALRSDTQYVRIIADVAVCVVAGNNPTATVNSMMIGPYTPEYFAVIGGEKLAVILAG